MDRWILDEKNEILFQCEIKNWAATALGGKQLGIDASNEEIEKVVKYYWERELNGNGNLSSNAKHPNGVTKVLLKMKVPKEINMLKVEPLVIYWMPISSDPSGLNPLTVVSIKSLKLPIKTEFEKLNVFSVSIYLRQLYKKGEKFIDLDIMPHFANRVEILNRLQSKK